jgi:excisionase family DNA binding protein
MEEKNRLLGISLETMDLVPAEQRPAVLAHLLALQARVVARLVLADAHPLPPPVRSPSAWLTVKEAGERLKKSPTWVRRSIKRQELPAKKMGGEWRIPEHAVSASDGP